MIGWLIHGSIFWHKILIFPNTYEVAGKPILLDDRNVKIATFSPKSPEMLDLLPGEEYAAMLVIMAVVCIN